MFVRFVVPIRHRQSHCWTGVFQVTDRLQLGDGLDSYDQGRLERVLDWFNAHLPVPVLRSRGRQRHGRARAIFWLREGPTGCMEKLRELATLLEHHGIATRKLRTRRPGYIVYEDRYQVAAVPFRDTRA